MEKELSQVIEENKKALSLRETELDKLISENRKSNLTIENMSNEKEGILSEIASMCNIVSKNTVRLNPDLPEYRSSTTENLKNKTSCSSQSNNSTSKTLMEELENFDFDPNNFL